MDLKQAQKEIEEAYLEATGSWTGCDWCTGEDFIADLDGMSIGAAEDYQADDPEHEDEWERAISWLQGIADDAERAEESAARSVEAFRGGDIATALDFAREAAGIEAEYGDSPVWGPYRNTVRYWAKLMGYDE